MEKEFLNEERMKDVFDTIWQFGVSTDRDNANVGNNFSAKMLRIASESNKLANLAHMPEKDRRLHEEGQCYQHDLDSYNLTVNCLHVDLYDKLKKGFNTGYGYIRIPKDFITACALSCIIVQSVQNDQFGGVAFNNFDCDLAKFASELERKPTDRDIRQGVQGVVYNLNTMHCRAGSQVPFSSLNIGLVKNDLEAKICQYLLEEYDKGLGHGEPAIFPNLIFRVKAGVNRNPGDPYYYLYQLACKVASTKMNPTFMNIDSSYSLPWYLKGYIPATMGCRTALMDNINGEPGTEGRGNICPVTMNLPRLALKCKEIADPEKRIDQFFELLDECINDTKDCLLHRYEKLCQLKVKDLPFIIGQGFWVNSEGLKPEDSIEPAIKNGTLGIGFIGLAETLICLIGKHHGESEEAQKLAYTIVSYIRSKCDSFKYEYKMNFSCYATPAEGISGKLIKLDKKDFGEIKGVTDKGYYTNSFHVPVYYPISIEKKLEIEAPFHAMCNGGHISYVELDNYPTADQIEKIVSNAFINTDISYLGINFHIRYCKDCFTYLKGYENKCHNCHGEEIQGISRVTGYLSFDERFGVGKANERADRTAANGMKVYQN